jgi:hypothetical protein
MFRPPGCPMPAVHTPTPRAVVERWAADLMHELTAGSAGAATVRVMGTAGGLACLVLVWPADGRMPTLRRAASKSGPGGGGRERCKSDVLVVVRAAGGPLTRKEVVRALRESGTGHGAGTVAKVLADLTRCRELVNPRDKRGYRLPERVRPHPSLFDDA